MKDMKTARLRNTIVSWKKFLLASSRAKSKMQVDPPIISPSHPLCIVSSYLMGFKSREIQHRTDRTISVAIKTNFYQSLLMRVHATVANTILVPS